MPPPPFTAIPLTLTLVYHLPGGGLQVPGARQRVLNPHGNKQDRELVQTANLSAVLPQPVWCALLLGPTRAEQQVEPLSEKMNNPV